MLEGNRFADLIPGNTVPNAGAPTFIPAPPKVPTPQAPDSPLDAEAKRLEIELKRQRLAKGEPAGPGEAELKAAEQKASFLTTNLLGNINIMQKAIKADPSATAPTWDQLAVGILGTDVKNAYLPAQRQVIENSQRLITDAALTLGTGAAYTPEQIEAYRRGFFPQVGDTKEAIAAKREALRTALVAARIGAGAGAAQIDQAMEMLGFSGDPLAPGAEALPTTVDTGAPKPVLDEQGRPLMEVTIENPMEASADARRAEAYRQKQDRTFGPISPGETMLIHGMSGTLSDEAAGVGGFFSNLLTGQNPFTGYVTGRDAERLRIEDAREQLGGWGTAAEIGGGFLSFNPAAAMAAPASALAAFTQGAKGGAAGGAVFGFGSGEGFGDSLEKGAIGAGLGAGLGVALPAAGMAAERALGARGMAPDLAAAARAEQVRLRRPMFDERSRIRAGRLESSTGSAPVIQRAMQETADDIEAAAGRVGGSGNVLEPGPAGEQVQNAGRRFIQRTKGVADRLYNRARSLAGDARVSPTNAIAQVDREIAELSQNPEMAQGQIEFLQRLRNDLAMDGGKTTESLRALRTSIRERVNEANLTATQAEARAHRVLDAVHQDLASLPNGAAQAFRRADMYYRERMVHIDDVLERFIGQTKAGQPRLSGEQALKQLKTMASPGGDGRRLAALWRDMTPDEQADVAATLMHSIGRRDADAPFSVDLFLSHVRNLSPSARRTIFGPSGAESVNRLVTLSRSLQQAGREINRTKSGTTVKQAAGRAVAAALLGGGGGAMVGGAGTAGLAAGGAVAAMGAAAGLRNLSARALMSPRISAWLADVANATTPAQVQRLANRLGVIAAREPALAGELAPIQQQLSGQAAVPALAEGREDQQ